MVNNNLYLELIDLKIIDKNKIEEFYPYVRDNKNIPVMRCKKSGVIFLKNLDHVSNEHYTEMENFSYWESKTRDEALELTYGDDIRRFKSISHLIENKSYLDFGCGLGGVLDMAKQVTTNVSGLEPQKNIADNLRKLNYTIFESIEEIINNNIKFDVITLFHVFEHVPNPLEILEKIHTILNPDGYLIIEVPNANDALITLYNLESFKEYTFWSEHLILHTKNSLKKYLKISGFKNIKINGLQRYGLSNHLYWLKDGKPGGQNIFKEINGGSIDREYFKILNKNNLTDTIISICQK
jgi:2-polyprenyl-3-methyl-5-hydroxy-6-metoxy-1,4-benzoquinol methylase